MGDERGECQEDGRRRIGRVNREKRSGKEEEGRCKGIYGIRGRGGVCQGSRRGRAVRCEVLEKGRTKSN
jgi:hypothetical protein